MAHPAPGAARLADTLPSPAGPDHRRALLRRMAWQLVQRPSTVTLRPLLSRLRELDHPLAWGDRRPAAVRRRG
ncbi:hypothetical protein DY245_31490 [Streptomyces inhibens]|uniref:Uncharacterized protein n=1 Tax=Streptomyces inhibens TaxID=2293571 RepID=A0A371PVW8_STRIH|nr:hypothetical protein [Streptomyces inhibens]REK86600.1 hypothetical protein DY245_31490 [Streptomyces inhibens]